MAKPYGIKIDQRKHDHELACNLEQVLFEDFYLHLNDFHNLSHSRKFWKILIGHWFRRMIHTLVNRYNTFDYCFQNYKISGTTVWHGHKFDLATSDTHTFTWATSDTNWNNELNKRILSMIDAANFPIEIAAPEDRDETQNIFRLKEVDHGKSQVSHLKKNTINFLSKILNRFVLKMMG